MVTVTFKEAGAGLKTLDGSAVKGFALAGADGVFHWATAKIVGDKVMVTSEKVDAPKFVRYAWADNPEANLVNSSGLPAASFRTNKAKLSQ
jgi:sialate O-acetylesterase